MLVVLLGCPHSHDKVKKEEWSSSETPDTKQVTGVVNDSLISQVDCGFGLPVLSS